MSDKDVRRPRSIIEAPPDRPPGAPPPYAAAQAERFQRALHGRRYDGVRSERAVSLRSGPSTAPTAGPEPSGDTGRRPSAGSSAGSSAVSGSAPTTTAAVTGRPVAETAPTGFAPILHQPVMPEPEDDAQSELAPVAAPDTGLGWDTDLVNMIVAMCQRTAPSIEAWSIVLPMNGDVLPETELHLSLSAHRLSLRFHTQSGFTLRVLSRHKDALLAMLQQALPNQREIDIDTT